MLSLHHLEIRYGDTVAVHDLSLNVRKGEIMALVGPTGCGKSSVLRAVAGLIKPYSGEIVIEGICTSRRQFVPPEKRRTGLVFQDFALFPHLSVEQNIRFRARDSAEVERWIHALGLAPFRHSRPETLSGGQKQRVALARSLAHQPRVILLDEPLSNLDAAMKQDLRATIRDALQQAKVTSIWVTHAQDEAMAIGDRIAVMRDGRLEQVDLPARCYESPANRFVASFFGDGLFLPGKRYDGTVQTSLGEHPLTAETGAHPAPDAPSAAGQAVDVLLRPHDIALRADTPGNAVVEDHRFEGETRCYRLRLDSGERVAARLTHEHAFAPGTRVCAYIAAEHPLVAFSPQSP
ncbi:MAG: ABC transporter ATP-binding protein [Opitutales bacterium]